MRTLLNCVGLDYHEDTIRVCVMTPLRQDPLESGCAQMTRGSCGIEF